MNSKRNRPLSDLWSADFLSPKDFVRHAVLLLLAFGVAHLLGLRAYTSVLSGTTGSLNTDPETAALLGVLYVLIYLGAVILVPTFCLAAGLLALWEKFRQRQGKTP